MQAVVKFPDGKNISFNGLFAAEEASRFVFAYWIDHNIMLESAIEEGAVPGALWPLGLPLLFCEVAVLYIYNDLILRNKFIPDFKNSKILRLK